VCLGPPPPLGIRGGDQTQIPGHLNKGGTGDEKIVKKPLAPFGPRKPLRNIHKILGRVKKNSEIYLHETNMA